MLHKYILLVGFLLIANITCAQQVLSHTENHVSNIDEHMDWWREAKFGMFVHWGLYAIPARGEWVMHSEKIPVKEYEKLASKFNPIKFNAEQWVSIAKDAGMKYIIITSKHHDGFAMFNSEISPFNIIDATPFKRDPMKELAEACKKEGIKFGFYYSHAQDWHHPGGAAAKGSWDPMQKGDFEKYLRTISIPQIKELLIKYNPDVFWFDSPHKMTAALAREVVQVVRTISPEIIVNSRILYPGRDIEFLKPKALEELRDIGSDYLTYRDREIPENPVWKDWETCMTLNEAWGYNASDNKWKSPETIINMLVRIVHKNGNFLLNFGPTAEGELPLESVKIVKQAGSWLRENGESIYGARASDLGVWRASNEAPIKKGNHFVKPDPIIDWLATERPASLVKGQPAKIYLHIFKWPKGEFKIDGISDSVNKAYVLAKPEDELKFKQNKKGLTISLPKKPTDKIVSVICLEIK